MKKQTRVTQKKKIMDSNNRKIQISIFFISPQKHMMQFSLEVPHWGTSNE